MSEKGFDWDAEFAKVSFKELRERSPQLNSVRLPSCFSPDEKWYYCSSADIDTSTEDEDELRSTLDAVINVYHSAEANDYWRKFVSREDCRTLCGILSALIIGDDFSDPDGLLAEQGQPAL